MSKGALRLKFSGLALALILTSLALTGFAGPAQALLAGRGSYSSDQTPYCQFRCLNGTTGSSNVPYDYAGCISQCESACGGLCLVSCLSNPGWC